MRSTTICARAALVVLSITCLGRGARTAQFYFNDFNSYATDLDVTNDGWIIDDTAAAVEDSTWTITNPGSRPNPAGITGGQTSGGFLISDSDAQSQSNPVDSGASHDLVTPAFSTAGTAGDVWLHLDTTAMLNENGAAVYDIDVSTDNGTNWTNAFRRVSPGRVSSNAATTILPTNANADGFMGRLDVNLGAVGGVEDVRVRFRHYEPNFDWWVAVDNVRVDDVAPPSGGSETLFEENFNEFTLGQMIARGLNAGTTDGWTTADGAKGNRYTAGTVQEQGVNRLGHPTAESAAGNVPFAIVDSDADPDPLQDEWLLTPALDLSRKRDVFLHWDSEIIPQGDAHEVLALRDEDGDGPDVSDTMLGMVFAYQTDELGGAEGEEPLYAQRVVDVTSLTAGLDSVFFAWRYAGLDDWWWAVDNIAVTANPIPEPGTLAIALLCALSGLAVWLRRRWG